MYVLSSILGPGSGPDWLQQALPLLIPVVLAQLGLMIFCLVDIQDPDRQVKGGNKIAWRLIIIFITTIGPLVYLVWGREDI